MTPVTFVVLPRNRKRPAAAVPSSLKLTNLASICTCGGALLSTSRTCVQRIQILRGRLHQNVAGAVVDKGEPAIVGEIDSQPVEVSEEPNIIITITAVRSGDIAGAVHATIPASVSRWGVRRPKHGLRKYAPAKFGRNYLGSTLKSRVSSTGAGGIVAPDELLVTRFSPVKTILGGAFVCQTATCCLTTLVGIGRLY